MNDLSLGMTPSLTRDVSSQYALLSPIASLNYDIITRITEFIAGDISPEFRKRNGHFRQLYHFALTCQAFVDAALDELWRSMDTIVPLLKILPELQHKDNRYFVLTGSIHPEGLKRMQIYSRRIQIFTLNEGSVPAVPQIVIPILMPVLPIVRQLCYSLANPFVRTWSPIILSERLQYFRLEGYFFSNTLDVKSILHSLQFTAPTLEHLHLIDPLTDEVLNLVPTFIRLRSLGIHGIIEHHHFRQFATLPELRELNVNFHISHPFPSFPLKERINVPTLQVLHITGVPLTVASVLSAMCGGSPKDVRVTFERESKDLETSLEQSLATLIDQWSSTVQSVTLNLTGYSNIPPILSPSHLDSFSQLPCLEVLHILGLVLDTPRFKVLARSIPSIKELKFEICDSHDNNENSQSLDFLRFIAESCPRISTLQVKCIYNVHLHTIPDSILSNISLTTLTFETYDKHTNDIDFEQVAKVARYIDLLFPRMETITTSSKAKAFAIFWRQVFQQVKQSQKTRRDTEKPCLPNEK